MEVIHDEKNQQFYIDCDGKRAELDYRNAGNTIAFVHTGVPREFEGRGIAGQLVNAGLTWARAKSATVAPQCSYVLAYIRRHPEWADLVDETWKARLKR